MPLMGEDFALLILSSKSLTLSVTGYGKPAHVFPFDGLGGRRSMQLASGCFRS